MICSRPSAPVTRLVSPDDELPRTLKIEATATAVAAVELNADFFSFNDSKRERKKHDVGRGWLDIVLTESSVTFDELERVSIGRLCSLRIVVASLQVVTQKLCKSSPGYSRLY